MALRETLTTSELREVVGDGGGKMGKMMAMDWEHPCPCGCDIAVRSGVVAKRALLDALLDESDESDVESDVIDFPQRFQCPGCNFVVEVRFTLNELGSCCFFAGQYDRALEYYSRAHARGELTEIEYAYNMWEALNEWSRSPAGSPGGSGGSILSTRAACEVAKRRFENSGCDADQVAELTPRFWFEEVEALARAEAEAEAQAEAIAEAQATQAAARAAARAKLGLSPDAARKRSRSLLKKLRRISVLRESLADGTKKECDLNTDQIAMMGLEENILLELLELEEAFGSAAMAASAAVAAKDEDE